MKLLSVIAAGVLAASAATAADRLTLEGTPLPSRTIVPGEPLEAVVEIGDDEVLAVHAILRPASSNLQLMRDRDGYWSEWNGDRDALSHSAARQEGDTLVFKLFQTPPDGYGAMTITLAYRTAEGLKFGWFAAARSAGGTN